MDSLLIQYEIAKKYPRDINKIKLDIINILKKENIENLFYKIPRKDKNGKLFFVEGLSIRFAEIIVSNYKNIKINSYFDKIENNLIICKCNIIDFETNTNITIDVSKSIIDKYNNKLNNEQIALFSNSLISIAFRNSIYKIIPNYLINEILNELKNNIKNKIKNNFNEIKYSVINYFNELNIKNEVFNYLDIKSENDINEDILYNLYGLRSSIINNEIDKSVFVNYTNTNTNKLNKNNVNTNNNSNNKDILISRFNKAIDLFAKKGVSKEVIYSKFNIKSENDVNLSIINELLELYKKI